MKHKDAAKMIARAINDALAEGLLTGGWSIQTDDATIEMENENHRIAIEVTVHKGFGR